MSTWILGTAEKKQVQEEYYWKHPDYDDFIVVESWWRWGTFQCESEKRPDIDLQNEYGLSVYDTEYDFQLVSLDDGIAPPEVHWPSSIPEEVREELQALWDEDGDLAWEESGMECTDVDITLHGRLELESEEERAPE